MNTEHREPFGNKYTKLAIIAGTIIVLDQITKALILKYIPLHNTISVIPGFFNLTHIQNPGGAFGFMANQGPGIRSVLFLFVSLIAIGVIFYFYKTSPAKDKWLTTSLSLIFGGAIGNMIDRIRLGQVVDFLDFYIDKLPFYWRHYPSFNVADSAVTIGVTIFIVQAIVNNKKKSSS
jgi:signal peptidase II